MIFTNTGRTGWWENPNQKPPFALLIGSGLAAFFGVRKRQNNSKKCL